jgi:hypothetical protein
VTWTTFGGTAGFELDDDDSGAEVTGADDDDGADDEDGPPWVTVTVRGGAGLPDVHDASANTAHSSAATGAARPTLPSTWISPSC